VNDVNFTTTSGEFAEEFLSGEGTLANIAPTILKLAEVEQPKEMTSKSLIK
jgi:bisphosphoglycerate-independent phosphoglycerate mutase (AlkP superfamily)